MSWKTFNPFGLGCLSQHVFSLSNDFFRLDYFHKNIEDAIRRVLDLDFVKQQGDISKMFSFWKKKRAEMYKIWICAKLDRQDEGKSTQKGTI